MTGRHRSVGIDDVVEKIDAMFLAVEGAAYLAWTGEFADELSLIIIETAAVMDLATEKLNLNSRKLTGAKAS